jgi:hypothetical protein
VLQMGRRTFIGLGLGAMGAMCVGNVAGSTPVPSEAADLTVFDQRFPQASTLAFRFADGGSTQPIAADVTDLALWLRSRAVRGRRTCVRGVTPESVPFCLRQMAPRVGMSIRRIDRDLFAWAVRLPG